MIDDHGQVLVAPAVGDLINANATQSLEGIALGHCVANDPGDDRPHTSPAHSHQFSGRRLGGVGHHPGHLVVEVWSVTGAVTGSGHLGDRRSVLRAVHSWGVFLQLADRQAEVEGPPIAMPLSLGITRAARPAEATTASLLTSRAHVNHHRTSPFVELNRFDNRGSVDTEHLTSYIGCEHANLLASFSCLSSTQETRQELALLISRLDLAPTH